MAGGSNTFGTKKHRNLQAFFEIVYLQDEKVGIRCFRLKAMIRTVAYEFLG
jgi:hypothetical protein